MHDSGFRRRVVRAWCAPVQWQYWQGESRSQRSEDGRYPAGVVRDSKPRTFPTPWRIGTRLESTSRLSDHDAVTSLLLPATGGHWICPPQLLAHFGTLRFRTIPPEVPP